MENLYPEESQKLDVIGHLEELRRRILTVLAGLALIGIALFSRGEDLMRLVQRPSRGLVSDLIFIAPAEAFTAYLKVVLLAAFIVSFPLMMYQIWAFLKPALPMQMRSRMKGWILLVFLLFIGGMLFSYFLAIPAALKFLLGFGSKIAQADITLGKYVSFFVALMLTGGLIFQLPVVIGALADLGLVTAHSLRRKRAQALVMILIIAAVLTPTQDVFNMLFFALPMAGLYEAGILMAVFLRKDKNISAGERS